MSLVVCAANLKRRPPSAAQMVRRPATTAQTQKKSPAFAGLSVAGFFRIGSLEERKLTRARP
jgi:hypothetical protein